MAKLTYLVIHCTATPKGRWVSPTDIIKWHTAPKPVGRGWDRVGYSKLILLDGKIHNFINENDNDLVENWELTYGVAGINSISRHICYVGGLDGKLFTPKDTRTVEQMIAMEDIVTGLIEKHPEIKVAGHYQFARKACPCFDVVDWCKQIKLHPKNIYGV